MIDDFYRKINAEPIHFMGETKSKKFIEKMNRDLGFGTIFEARGQKCVKLEKFYPEMALALDVSKIAPESLEALEKVMTEMDLISTQWYIFYLFKLEKVSPEDDDFLKSLLKTLLHTCRHWADKGIPYNVLLSGTVVGMDRAKELLTNLD